MKPLAERLRAWVAEFPDPDPMLVEDMRLAAKVIETKAGDPYPLKGVPTLAEERLAWDRYAAHFLAGVHNSNIRDGSAAAAASKFADELLEERRKRFGASK